MNPSDADTQNPAPNKRDSAVPLTVRFQFLLPGLFLIITCLTIRYWPIDFQRETKEEGWFLVTIISLLCITGIFYLLFSRQLQRSEATTKISVLIIILIAVIARLLMLGVPPKVEDDYFRYLWDGAVTAQGLDPYQYSPETIIKHFENLPSADQQAFTPLVQAAGSNLHAINHSELRTIYPPLAQGMFALSYWIKPFSADGLRIVFFLLEGALIALFFVALRGTKNLIPALLLYLWNPLLIYEIYYRCHYDLLVGVLIFAFVLAIFRLKHIIASLMLALAIGAKLWPILLTPFLIIRFWDQKKKCLLALAILIGVCSLMLIPYQIAINRYEDSGALNYAKEWEANALAHIPIRKLGRVIKDLSGVVIDERVPVRGFVTLITLIVCIWLARKCNWSVHDLSDKTAWSIMIMLLLSPTVYGWYYIVMIPLAVFSPRLIFLTWTILFPLTYLWMIPDFIMGFILHLPIWFMILNLWYKNRQLKGSSTLAE